MWFRRAFSRSQKGWFHQIFRSGLDSSKISHPKAAILKLNLLQPNAQELIWQWLSNPMCFFVHAGPPCGTASRAREIRLSRFRRGPIPLRSRMYPDGVPGLAGLKFARVQSANSLYRFTIQVLQFCIEKDLPFTVENPTRSRLWDTSFWTAFSQQHGHALYVVDFQSCAYGGKRPKWTRLVSNRSDFLSLARPCPGDHIHLPWGFAPAGSAHTFSTAEEAEYPHGL